MLRSPNAYGPPFQVGRSPNVQGPSPPSYTTIAEHSADLNGLRAVLSQNLAYYGSRAKTSVASEPELSRVYHEWISSLSHGQFACSSY